MREFDLNIERVLENWTVAHAALREVIANALDERALTGTTEVLDRGRGPARGGGDPRGAGVRD